MEQGEHFPIAGRSAKLYSYFGNQYGMGGFSENWESIYFTAGHKKMTPQRHLLSYAHSSIVHNTQKLEQPRCLSTDEFIKKMWHNHIMENYSAVKNNDIMKFESKWK